MSVIFFVSLSLFDGHIGIFFRVNRQRFILRKLGECASQIAASIAKVRARNPGCEIQLFKIDLSRYYRF